MQQFSFYKKGITNKIPSANITLEEALSFIQGETYRDCVERLRTTADKKERAAIKKDLDYFTFSGTFSKRLTDNLIQHSGLIVLDLDDLNAELYKIKEWLKADPFTLSCFISPSGTGLKVLIRIEPDKHLQSFLALEKQFRNHYQVEVDKSGKDVTRACFVSYDPDLFFNPESEVFIVTDEMLAEPEPTAPIEAKKATVTAAPKASNSIDRFTKQKNIDRARYVADQIQNNHVDITADYDDWQLVAFALATLGEDGRQIFHDVSRFNHEYTWQYAEEKFTNALETKTKFTTPAKFFSIAQVFGLDTKLPKTIEEKKHEADIKDIIPGAEERDDYLLYGIWEADGIYYSLDSKNRKVQISNFCMRILYIIESNTDDSFRMIEIKNVWGLKRVIRLSTDDFTSVGSFRKQIERKGNFLFKGTDSDLYRLKEKLQREEKPTSIIDRLGWNKKGRFYAFANGIYCVGENKFIKIDEYGIVEHHLFDKDGNERPQNYFIPALSKIFEDKDDLFGVDKKFIYQTSDVDFETWAQTYALVYNKQGYFSMMYYVMALFSDIIFKDIGGRFPMMYVYGKRGTGKGTLIASLMRLFGVGQDQIMLGGATTVVGFMRKLGQFKNALVWLDEYKNNLAAKIIESLKNIYDRKGYERGKKDNTFQTESTPIESAAFLSGQEMPTIEPALFTRVILVSLTQDTFTETQRQNMRKLEALEEKGLSGITVGMLQHRDWFEKNFKSFFQSALRSLRTSVNNDEINERLFVSYACLIATAELLEGLVELPFQVPAFREICKKNLLEQWYVLKGSDDASKFWDVVEQIFGEGKIKENQHFQLRNGNLYLRVQDIYPHYSKALGERRDPNMLDKSTLEKYLESDSKSFIAREKKFFGGAQKWCFTFKYNELPVDLIREDDITKLKIKYKEMGVDFQDEVPAGDPLLDDVGF